MPSLKALKTRIASVKSTQKITKAMKMVAAAKLRRAQEAAEAARPYAERMEAVVASLGARVGAAEGAPPLLAGTGRDQKHLLVVATSERGLAGGFNTNIVKLARKTADGLLAQGKDVSFYLVGKKGRAQIIRLYKDRIGHYQEQDATRRAAFVDAQAIASDVVARFERGEFDVAHLFYAHFRSVLVQEPVRQQLVPVALPAGAEAVADGGAVVDYEPSEEAILADLLPRNVAVQVFRALLENAASEQGARMTAMDNATRNAGDVIGRLTLTYNRTRQAAITKELIEIISGAEAL
jgi:F-type H+-transporting ATPase subunit gamma